MSTKDMIHQSCFPHTARQNGIAKRKHPHILYITRTMLIQGNAPLKFGQMQSLLLVI